MSRRRSTSSVMGPPPDRDVVMGPPPIPAPLPSSSQQKPKDSQDIVEKYRKLKRRFFELEEKHKETSTELQRSGERNVKMREERNILLDRIIELESQPQAQSKPNGTSSASPPHTVPIPQPTSSALPRTLLNARARSSFIANLRQAIAEDDVDEDVDPLLTSRHVGPMARKREEDERKERLEEDAREARRSARKAKNTSQQGSNGHKGKEASGSTPAQPLSTSSHHIGPGVHGSPHTSGASPPVLVSSTGTRLRIKPPVPPGPNLPDDIVSPSADPSSSSNRHTPAHQRSPFTQSPPHPYIQPPPPPLSDFQQQPASPSHQHTHPDHLLHSASPETSMPLDPQDDHDQLPSPVGGGVEMDDDSGPSPYSPLSNTTAVYHGNGSGTPTAPGKGDNDSNYDDSKLKVKTEGNSTIFMRRREGFASVSPQRSSEVPSRGEASTPSGNGHSEQARDEGAIPLFHRENVSAIRSESIVHNHDESASVSDSIPHTARKESSAQDMQRDDTLDITSHSLRRISPSPGAVTSPRHLADALTGNDNDVPMRDVEGTAAADAALSGLKGVSASRDSKIVTQEVKNTFQNAKQSGTTTNTNVLTDTTQAQKSNETPNANPSNKGNVGPDPPEAGVNAAEIANSNTPTTPSTSGAANTSPTSTTQAITPLSVNPYSMYYPGPPTPLTPNTPTYAHPYANPYYPYHHMGAPVPGPSTAYAPSPNFVPPSTQRPPSEVQRHAKPKRLKAHTVTSKSFSIPMVPRDKKGKPMLPLNVGIMTVINLGDVCMREHFHTERYIFPVGYEVTRRYLSTVDPNIEVVYHCTILDGGDGPKFQIVPSDVPDRPVIAGTATGAWSNIVKQANSIRNRQHSNSVSGPDFFGLGQNTIKHLIQELNGADRLRDYVWQNFVEGGPLGGRHAAVIPALPEEYDASMPIGAYYPHDREKQKREATTTPESPRVSSHYPQHILTQAQPSQAQQSQQGQPSQALQPGVTQIVLPPPTTSETLNIQEYQPPAQPEKRNTRSASASVSSGTSRSPVPTRGTRKTSRSPSVRTEPAHNRHTRSNSRSQSQSQAQLTHHSPYLANANAPASSSTPPAVPPTFASIMNAYPAPASSASPRSAAGANGSGSGTNE